MGGVHSLTAAEIAGKWAIEEKELLEMKLMRTLLLFVALAFAANIQAAPDVGTEAPAVGVSTWAMNAPESFDGTLLKGQVTFVELWGIN